MEQARIEGLRAATEDEEVPEAANDDGGDTATLASRADVLTLDEIPIRNLSPTFSVPFSYPIRDSPPPSEPEIAAPQPSRFHEHGIGISPAPTNGTLPNEPGTWTQSAPPPMPTGSVPPASPKPEVHYPPEGYIPSMGSDGLISLPTPHDMAPRPQTPASPLPLPIPPPDVCGHHPASPGTVGIQTDQAVGTPVVGAPVAAHYVLPTLLVVRLNALFS